MFNNFFLKLFITVPLFTFLLSCSQSSVYEKVYPSLLDGKYDSEFPYRNSSKQLEEISNSIRLVNSIAFYESFIFDQKNKFTLKQSKNIDLEKNASEKVYFNHTASGAGTIVLENHGLVGVLTVAHVVSFPDTVYSYFINPDGTPTEFIESISIKLKQTNYIPEFPEGGELSVILKDKNLDIALLGKKYSPNQTANFPVFKYPWGKADELEWGTFVYVFGFPMNYKMVSKGIISSPDKEKNTFLLDAVFNRGYSGGIILAIRDGVPNFELVGIVKSVPAEFEYTIRPLTRERDLEFNSLIPFKGEVYVDKQQVLRMGITKAIGIESIIKFLIDHKDELISRGYVFSDLFTVQSQTILKQIK